MNYSTQVSLSGLAVGIIGTMQGRDIFVLGGFIILAAACICHAIELTTK